MPMIVRAFAALCAVALFTATAVMAQSTGGSGKAAKADANRRICRVYDDTGSRLNRYRACHTAAEWGEMRRQTIQNVDHIQNARVFGQ
jgi:hypothetical protein